MKGSYQDMRYAVSFDSHKEERKRCPNCNNRGLSVFYSVEDIPVHSCLLMPSRSEAKNYPHGNLSLGLCSHCGFITNTKFDSQLHEYSTRYEETQGFSACFNQFAKSLAEELVHRYSIYKKDILEIGCGKGEFLALLCELGQNRGIGIDPAYVPQRVPGGSNLKLTFIQDFYSEKYANLSADVICCRHTLEHIAPTGRFLRSLRKSIGERHDTLIFFEVPDMVRVLREGAFWDIYYEHCSYFTRSSLMRLFQITGFRILELKSAFDDQYLLLTACPATGGDSLMIEEAGHVPINRYVDEFRISCSRKIEMWHGIIQKYFEKGQRIVIWGSGSKGVAFLTTLGLAGEIEYVVDINPYRQGKFMPGTGQQIVSPAFLKSYHPDLIIVMNPIYIGEIQAELHQLNIAAEILSVSEPYE